MANYIMLNKAIILRCSNCAMNCFYENLLEIAEKEDLKDNEELMKLIAELDQNTYGLGCVGLDITQELHSLVNIKLFARLVEKTIEKIKSDKKCAIEIIEIFVGFSDALNRFIVNQNSTR